MIVICRDLRGATAFVRAAAVLVLVTALVGCDSDEVAGPEAQEVEEVLISPDTARLSPGETIEFSAHAVTALGDTVDLAEHGMEWRWWSSDPSVFAVQEDGTATGHTPGEEYCVVEATSVDAAAKSGGLRFVGRDSAVVMVF